jgi:hypothetical protein
MGLCGVDIDTTPPTPICCFFGNQWYVTMSNGSSALCNHQRSLQLQLRGADVSTIAAIRLLWDTILRQKIQLANTEVCNILVDQRFFNGIGNFMRAEILHRSGINPFDSAEMLKSPGIVMKLFRCIHELIYDMNAIEQSDDSLISFFDDCRNIFFFRHILQCYGKAKYRFNNKNSDTIHTTHAAGELFEIHHWKSVRSAAIRVGPWGGYNKMFRHLFPKPDNFDIRQHLHFDATIKVGRGRPRKMKSKRPGRPALARQWKTNPIDKTRGKNIRCSKMKTRYIHLDFFDK